MATYDGNDVVKVEVGAVKTNMSKARGKLKRDDEKRLRANYSYLAREIDAEYLVPELFSKFVLDEDDKQKILSKATARERTLLLLDIMLNSGPGEAYNTFVEVLTTKYPHVVKELTEEPLVKEALKPSYAPGTQHSSEEATKTQGTSTTGYKEQSTEIDGRATDPVSNWNAQMATFNSGDVPETDAVPEDTPGTQHSSEETTNSQGTSTTDYSDYLDLIKSEIPNNIEILIISHEEDEVEVKEFKKNIEQKVELTICTTPMGSPLVEILRDIPGFSPKIVDKAFNRALFIFLFVTENLCKENDNILECYTFLKKSLKDKNKKKFVIPVHTSPKESRSYKLVSQLDILKSLCYCDADFFEKVIQLLESQMSTILNKRMDKEEEFKNHFAENRQRFLRNIAFLDSMNPKSSKQKTNLAFQTPSRNDPAGEVSLISHAVEAIKIRPNIDTESRQLVQSHANCVSHNSSGTKQSIMPDAKIKPTAVKKSFGNKGDHDLQIALKDNLSPIGPHNRTDAKQGQFWMADVVCDSDSQCNVGPGVPQNVAPTQQASDEVETDNANLTESDYFSGEDDK